jgi:putative phosphoesterase
MPEDSAPTHPIRIGVISDTHGLLRPEAIEAFAGVDRILHLGDIGDISILAALQRIAPVTAVRGNVDTDGPCSRLPAFETVDADGHTLYLLHNLATLDLDPAIAGFSAVLFGHTHQPKIESKNGVLYFNPGSAGPRRFKLPVTIGMLTIAPDVALRPEIVTLLD